MSNARQYNTAIIEQANKLAQEDIVDGVLIMVEKLLGQADLNAWTIGDLINIAGATPANIELFRKMTGSAKSTLENYAYTARTWVNTHEARWQYLYDESGEPTVVKYSHLSALNSIANDPEFGLAVAIDAINKLADGYMPILEFQRYIAVNIRKQEPKPKAVKIAEFKHDIREESYIGQYVGIPPRLKLEDGKTYLFKVYETESES